MNGEVNTMAQIMLAQNAGASTDTIHATLGAPAIVAAGLILAILILYAVISGIVKHFFTNDDQ